MNRSLALLLAVAASTAVGCRAVPRANVPPGTRVTVVLDRAVPADLPENKANAQRQIAAWMEQDLVRVLAQAGFQADFVASSKQVPAGSHALLVRIVKYNPGSAAGRMFVGYGVGAASLDVKYELRSRDGKVLFQKVDGVGSGVAWQKIARKLNVIMTKDVSATLGR
jgi:hypothetical protein